MHDLRIELRLGNASAAVLCRKTTPLVPGDLAFIHDDAILGIHGGTAAEQVQAIVDHFLARGARPTTRTGHWASTTP